MGGAAAALALLGALSDLIVLCAVLAVFAIAARTALQRGAHAEESAGRRKSRSLSHGKVRAVVKGVRKTKSRFGGRLYRRGMGKLSVPCLQVDCAVRNSAD